VRFYFPLVWRSGQAARFVAACFWADIFILDEDGIIPPDAQVTEP
jgi:hypothetical protein